MHSNFEKIPVSDGLDEAVAKGMQEVKRIHRVKIIKRTFISMGSAAAAFAVLLLVCLSNPVMASKLSLIGHIFDRMQEKASYSGDYSKVAQPLDSEDAKEPAYTQTVDGMTVTLSEIYCNDQALYISLLMESKEAFPETMRQWDTQQPILSFQTEEQWSFNPSAQGEYYYLEGDFIDDHTYAGIMRIDLKTKSIDSAEADAANDAAYTAGAEDGIASEEYQALLKDVTIPESFSLKLNIKMIIGALLNPETLDLGMSDEEWAALPEGEWQAILMEKESEGDWGKYPNRHQNYWFEGSWNYDLEVRMDSSKTQIVEVGTTNKEGIGIASVTKTPFEITMKEHYPEGNSGFDYFAVMTDANGDMMPSANGDVNTSPIQDRDVSKVDVYICDYDAYMDEIKGYYWSEDYEEKRKEKTFKEYLDEKALYHAEVKFDTEE